MTRLNRTMRSSVCILAALVAAVAWGDRGAADDLKVTAGKEPERKVLEQLAGRWDYTGTVYPEVFSPPGAKVEPVILSGVVESEFLSASSWLISRGKGKAGGQPYEYINVASYDAKKAKYGSTEINSLVLPPIWNDEGTYDEKSKTLTWTGTKVLPGSDQPVVTQIDVVFKDADTVVMTAFLKRPGSDAFVKWFDFAQKRR